MYNAKSIFRVGETIFALKTCKAISGVVIRDCRIGPRSQSYDFWIYDYNSSAVFSRLERFTKAKTIFFCFQNAVGYVYS
jgi:hypothetical protein